MEVKFYGILNYAIFDMHIIHIKTDSPQLMI